MDISLFFVLQLWSLSISLRRSPRESHRCPPRWTTRPASKQLSDQGLSTSMESYTLHYICPVLSTTQLIQIPSQKIWAVTMFMPMKAVTLHMGRAHTIITPIQLNRARMQPSNCKPTDAISVSVFPKTKARGGKCAGFRKTHAIPSENLHKLRQSSFVTFCVFETKSGFKCVRDRFTVLCHFLKGGMTLLFN